MTAQRDDALQPQADGRAAAGRDREAHRRAAAQPFRRGAAVRFEPCAPADVVYLHTAPSVRVDGGSAAPHARSSSAYAARRRSPSLVPLLWSAAIAAAALLHARELDRRAAFQEPSSSELQMLERPDRQIKAAWRAIGESPDPGASALDPGSEPPPVTRDAGSKPQPVAAGLSADRGTEAPTTQPERAAAAETGEPDASTSEANVDAGQASSDRLVAGEEIIPEPAADAGPAHEEADQSATKQAMQAPEREEDSVPSALSAPARLGGHPSPTRRRYAAARARLIAARAAPVFDPKLFLLEHVARKMP